MPLYFGIRESRLTREEYVEAAYQVSELADFGAHGLLVVDRTVGDYRAVWLLDDGRTAEVEMFLSDHNETAGDARTSADAEDLVVSLAERYRDRLVDAGFPPSS